MVPIKRLPATVDALQRSGRLQPAPCYLAPDDSIRAQHLPAEVPVAWNAALTQWVKICLVSAAIDAHRGVSTTHAAACCVTVPTCGQNFATELTRGFFVSFWRIFSSV